MRGADLQRTRLEYMYTPNRSTDLPCSLVFTLEGFKICNYGEKLCRLHQQNCTQTQTTRLQN
jgi:hypothetical protein